MGIELSEEAVELLYYLIENEDIFNSYFTVSKLSKILYPIFKGNIISCLNELVENNYVKKIKQFIGGFKYSLNKDEIETLKFLEYSQQEKPNIEFENREESEEIEEESIYNQEYRDTLENEIKRYKKFVVTTAVMGKEINKPFVEAIKNYAKRNNALLLVLPCEDVASRGKKADSIELSEELSDFKVIFKDTYINKNLCLSAIKVSAKQINPLTGLDRLTASRKASIIVASPKVFLKYIPNMPEEIPSALMTTGAITINNYDTDKYMSKRTSILAENDHAYGAIIVEVENEEVFHFRHVQASSYNSLTDMGIDYLPDGKVKVLKDTVMVVGDSHIGYHDEELFWTVIEIAQDVNTKEVILHDIFHGSSISHHDVNKGVTNAIKAREGRLGLELECKAVKNYLKNIADQGFKVTVIDSNHHDHLLRYLQESRYVNDPMNYEFSLKLALASVNKKNPLKYAIEELLSSKDDRINWLEVDKSYKIYDVECSLHGSAGFNGAKGSLVSFEKAIGNCVTAHTHTAAIIRKACSVGTTGLLDMDYNKGLSNWTRTCCLIYNNGTKQLINFIPNKHNEYKCRI